MTPTDDPKRSALENVYLFDLQIIKDTSLFHTTDAWSGPKWSKYYCIDSNLYNTNKARPRVRLLVLTLQFNIDHHEDGWFTRLSAKSVASFGLSVACLLGMQVIEVCCMHNLRTNDTSVIA